MTAEEIRAEVLSVLGKIAPEADPASLRADVGFREQLDVDSMDLLNFVVALHERLGVDIPETDYARLSTLDRCVEYLAARVPAGRNARGA
ncbi:MAG: acyl carrier protein [Candidatus Rokubacteria bacterium]|nr:acyl carrier protein [Candidatus Rokubacteria bacterium]OGL31397.1 MAG: hypothetical protein A3G97_13280 [Candidatus Rokubacteria bacterium RIFCSPLOWO2_12_FULL_69_21]